MKKAVWTILIVLLIHSPVFAADDAVLQRIMEEDASSVNALVMYPEGVRLAIFEVSKYPELLIRTRNLQNKTKAAFGVFMEEMPLEDQKKVWELSRYPALIAFMASEGKEKKKAELNHELTEFPTEIHDVARDFNKHKIGIILRLADFNQATQNSFESLIANYPEETKQAARELVWFPEALDILTTHIDLTTQLGDAYRKNADKVIQKATELNLKVARQNAEADADWKEELENSPEALAELQESAEEFIATGQNEPYVYRGVPSSFSVSAHFAYYPYSYWYGYPVW